MWIKVEDELPEQRKRVLVTIANRGFQYNEVAFHCGQCGMNTKWIIDGAGTVTHWQPLPELPKEGER